MFLSSPCSVVLLVSEIRRYYIKVCGVCYFAREEPTLSAVPSARAAFACWLTRVSVRHNAHASPTDSVGSRIQARGHVVALWDLFAFDFGCVQPPLSNDGPLFQTKALSRRFMRVDASILFFVHVSSRFSTSRARTPTRHNPV